MAEKKTKPDIRFRGFTKEWEQHCLSDVIENLYNGQTPSRNRDDFWNGNINWLSSGELNRSTVFRTSEKITVAGMNAAHLRIVPSGTFVIAITGLEAAGTRGNCGILGMDTTLNQSCMAIFPKVKVMDTNFLFQWYRKISELYGLIYTQGTKQQSYNANIILKLEITIPQKIEEQVEIGKFLSSLDKIANNYEKRLNKLINLKKSMLEKMFPKNGEDKPEIRFKEFNNAWQFSKMSELATFINGRAYSQDELLNNGKYRVLRVGNFYTNDSWYYSNLELADKNYARNGDLLYTWSATFGPHIWTGEKVIFHYHIWKVELNDLLDKHFAVHLLNYNMNQIVSDKNGSTMIHITKTGMEKTVILIPSIDEQRKIATYLDNLDDLIANYQLEIERLKHLKQACLERMFV